MRRGRQLAPLKITTEERESLEHWTRRPKTGQALAQRARISLENATGKSNTEVARRLRITKQMGANGGRGRSWASNKPSSRFSRNPRRLSDEEVERVLTMTLESTPKNVTHWSTRSLAAACGLSRSSVHRVWQAFALAPHRNETFKLSRDPLFIDKLRDIVGLPASPG